MFTAQIVHTLEVLEDLHSGCAGDDGKCRPYLYHDGRLAGGSQRVAELAARLPVSYSSGYDDSCVKDSLVQYHRELVAVQ